MTTKSEIVPAVVEPKLDSIEAELNQIERKQEQLLEGLLGEFAKSAETTRSKYELYKRLAVKDPLARTDFPQIADFIQSFKLSAVGKPPVVEEEKETKKTRKARGSYPEATLESVTALVKAGRDKGVKAGGLSKHFGLGQWNKKKNEMAKHFTIKKAGVSRIWFIK